MATDIVKWFYNEGWIAKPLPTNGTNDDTAIRLPEDIKEFGMATDIVVQLRELASSIERGNGKSTVYGAADEIERLRYERNEWFLVARQLRDAVMAKQEIDEALNDYLRVRGRLEDPRDAVEEVRGE